VERTKWGSGRRGAALPPACIGIDIAQKARMGAMHSYSKDQREVVNDLVRKVILTDMGNFTPDRFRDWTKNLDNQFRKRGLSLRFEIRQRTVHFTVRELRTGRRAFQFSASTHVRFEDRDVVMPMEDLTRRF
jgi:hypothetical protein